MKKQVTHLFLCALVVGAAASLAQNAQSQVLYDNGTASTYNGNFNYNNAQAGNEITLAGPNDADVITQFAVQFDLINSTSGTPFAGAPVGTEAVDLKFYGNNGPVVDGYASPGTLYYDSGFTTLASVGLNYFSEGQNLNYTPDAVVPQDFTWTLTFAGVPAGESAGLALRSTPTVGSTYGDAWYNDGSGWQLDVNAAALPGSPPLEFGAEAETAPDSSCLWFSVLAVGAGFWWMNRGTRRQPSS